MGRGELDLGRLGLDGDTLERLPSAIALPLADYAGEDDPLLALWHACDAVEIALRLAVALGVGDWRRAGGMPAALTAELAAYIEQPTLGRWLAMARALSRKPPADSPVPELYRLVLGGFDPLLSGEVGAGAGAGVAAPTASGAIERAFLELRNRLAHGGGMARGLAARLLAAWRERVAAVFGALAWMTELALVVPAAAGGAGVLRGPRVALASERPDDLRGTWPLAAGDDPTRRVVAMRGGAVLPLSPFLAWGAPVEGAAAVPLLYARRGEVRLAMTPLGSDEAAIAESDEAAVAELVALFPRSATVETARWEVSGFEAEWKRDASHVIGREAEGAAVLAAIERAPTGLVWVGGPAGIGKSYLIARVVAALGERTATTAPAMAVATAGGATAAVVLAYRFRAGDARCHRERFIAFAVERLRAAVAAAGGDAGKVKGAPAKQLGELAALVAGLVPRLVIVADGVDELAAGDPGFAAEVLAPLAARARVLVSGRPQSGLPDNLGASERPFPDGLPGLSAAEVRAMLVEKIGPLKKRLLAGDRDAGASGDAVVNPFLDHVVARAGGLPIYVSYVVGDVLAGKLRRFDEGASLPPSLEAYHAEVLARCAVGSLGQVLTPLVATLAVAHEPLSPATLHALLARRTLVPEGGDGRRWIGQALAVAAGLVRRIGGGAGAGSASPVAALSGSAASGSGSSGSSDDETFTLFHTSLRDHLRLSPANALAIATARRALAVAAASPTSLDVADAAADYLLRQGTTHLLEVGDVPAAAQRLASFDHLMRRLDRLGASATPGLLADLRAVAPHAAGAGVPELAAVASFLLRNAHLIEHAGDAAAPALLQAAIAEAERSPVTRAAEAWLAAETRAPRWTPRPWLRRLDRPVEPVLDPCLRTLAGHGAAVMDVALVPGPAGAPRRALSAGADATLRLWDLDRGTCLRVLAERQSSQSMTMVAATARAPTVRDLAGHGWTVWSVAPLADGKRALAAHGDRTVKLWDLDAGACLATLEGHTGYVWCVAAAADERLAASASDDGTVRLWDLAGQGARMVLDAGGWVGGVAFAPGARHDGGRLWSAGERGVIAWDVGGARLGTVDDRPAWCLAIAGDVTHLVSGSPDGDVTVYNLAVGLGGGPPRRWRAHEGGVWRVAFLDAVTVASAGRDGAVRVWRVDGQPVSSLPGHGRMATAAIGAGVGVLLSGGADRALKLWDLGVAAAAQGRPRHDGAVRDLVMLAASVAGATWAVAASEPARALSAGDDGAVKLWSLAAGQSLRTFAGHRGAVMAVCASPDGRGLISAGRDGAIQLWRADSGAPIGTLARGEAAVLALAAAPAPARPLVLAACADGALRVYDLATGALAATLAGHRGAIHAVAVAVDAAGARALSGGADGELRLWDLASLAPAPIATLTGHSWEIQAVALAGRRALSAGRDTAVKLWDLPSRRCLRTVARHHGGGRVLALWPDGELVATAAPGGEIAIWRPQADAERAAGAGPDDDIIARIRWPVAVTALATAGGPGNRRLAVGDEAGNVAYLALVE